RLSGHGRSDVGRGVLWAGHRVSDHRDDAQPDQLQHEHEDEPAPAVKLSQPHQSSDPHDQHHDAADPGQEPRDDRDRRCADGGCAGAAGLRMRGRQEDDGGDCGHHPRADVPTCRHGLAHLSTSWSRALVTQRALQREREEGGHYAPRPAELGEGQRHREGRAGLARVEQREIPVPGTYRRSSRATRVNAENSLDWYSGGMPTPLSATVTRPTSWSRASVMWMSPPSGEYLMAFDSRLLRIVRRRSGSPMTFSSSGNGSTTMRWLPSVRACDASTACSTAAPMSSRSERRSIVPSSRRATSAI